MSQKKEVIVVDYETFSSDEFKPPYKFYIKNCFGEYVFIYGKDRTKAQEEADLLYGKGHYKVVAAKQAKSGNHEISARGFINSKSRAGSRPVSN